MGRGAMNQNRTPGKDDRLKAALRENLKRRKAQARARAQDGRTVEPGPDAGVETGDCSRSANPDLPSTQDPD